MRRVLEQLGAAGLERGHLPAADALPSMRVLVHAVDAVDDVARRASDLQHALLVRQLEDLPAEANETESTHVVIELLHQVEEPGHGIKLVALDLAEVLHR